MVCRALIAAALLGASMVPFSSPGEARGGPKPVPDSEYCTYDPSFDETTCYYADQKDCWAARRAFHRADKSSMTPCYLSMVGLWAVTFDGQ